MPQLRSAAERLDCLNVVRRRIDEFGKIGFYAVTAMFTAPPDREGALVVSAVGAHGAAAF